MSNVQDISDLTSFKWATVTSISPLAIRLDGDTSDLAIVPDSLVDPYSLLVGDRVRVELTMRKAIIHNRFQDGKTRKLFGMESNSGTTTSLIKAFKPSSKLDHYTIRGMVRSPNSYCDFRFGQNGVVYSTNPNYVHLGVNQTNGNVQAEIRNDRFYMPVDQMFVMFFEIDAFQVGYADWTYVKCTTHGVDASGAVKVSYRFGHVITSIQFTDLYFLHGVAPENFWCEVVRTAAGGSPA